MPIQDEFESQSLIGLEMDDANLEIARPVHPLPDEIANLSLDETVCKYCGISYLIHREVARLQDQVQKLQAEIESSAEERENARAILELNDKYKIENGKIFLFINLPGFEILGSHCLNWPIGIQIRVSHYRF